VARGLLEIAEYFPEHLLDRGRRQQSQLSGMQWLRQRERDIAAPSIVPDTPKTDAATSNRR